MILRFCLSFAICLLFIHPVFADDYKKEILGSWYSIDDPSERIEFLENGKVNFYKEGEKYLTEDYFVTQHCNGDTLSYMDWKYLKTIDAAGETSCIEIQGIDLFGNGELWMMDREAEQLIKYSRAKRE